LRFWQLPILLLAACALSATLPPPANAPAPEDLVITTLTASPVPTETLLPTATAIPEPEGCLRPPDDYTRVTVRGHTLNRRTLAMLENTATLYGGIIDVANHAITQGSYVSGEELSFGTHSGGGAVDLSVIDRAEWRILTDEIEPLVRALRAAGFAAWLREVDELAPGSPIHIHAIAIGDAELSPAAQEQLTGEYGYFNGYNGLPEDFGGPGPDRHGGPLVCNWMRELGYGEAE
jgi:hypothetical protein